MAKRYIWALGIVLAVGSFWLGNYAGEYLLYANNLGVVAKLSAINANETLNTPPPNTSTLPPAPTTEPMPVGPAKVVAITDTSITLQVSIDKTRKFSITPDTDLYSVAAEGQQAKALADIQVGGTMTAYASEAEPTVARALIFPRNPSLALTPDEVTNSVSGKITALSASEVTITPADGSGAVVVSLNPQPTIVTTVTAGQTGRAMAMGDTIAASGLVAAGGKATAKLIVIAHTVR